MNASAPTLFRLSKNASDRQKRRWEEDMRRWLSDRIAQQLDAMMPTAAAVAHMTEAWLREWNEKYRIQQARSGNPEPLRRLYPQFSDCIHSPPLKQGCKYPPPPPKFDTARVAADFARRIRVLWRKQYGKMHREESEMSAEAFAVDICKEWFEEEAVNLAIDAVTVAAKPSGKHKPRRQITRQRV
jgi:hypothetical protein